MNKACPCCGYPFDETEAKYGGWISVDERLPDDRQHLIVYDKKLHVWGSVFEHGKFFDEIEEYHEFQNVTHWMPLPSIEGLEE